MAESYAELDTSTLRAMARGAGLPDADRMSHDQLVTALREAGVPRTGGEPVDTQLADPNDGGPGLHHGGGVGRRETLGGPGAGAGNARPGAPGPGS